MTWVFVSNNSGSRETAVRIVPYGPEGEALEGCGATCAATLAPSGGHAWATTALAGLPLGIGRAEILADGPIAVVVLEIGAGEVGAVDLAAYTGIRPSTRSGPARERVPVALGGQGCP